MAPKKGPLFDPSTYPFNFQAATCNLKPVHFPDYLTDELAAALVLDGYWISDSPQPASPKDSESLLDDIPCGPGSLNDDPHELFPLHLRRLPTNASPADQFVRALIRHGFSCVLREQFQAISVQASEATDHFEGYEGPWYIRAAFDMEANSWRDSMCRAINIAMLDTYIESLFLEASVKVQAPLHAQERAVRDCLARASTAFLSTVNHNTVAKTVGKPWSRNGYSFVLPFTLPEGDIVHVVPSTHSMTIKNQVLFQGHWRPIRWFGRTPDDEGVWYYGDWWFHIFGPGAFKPSPCPSPRSATFPSSSGFKIAKSDINDPNALIPRNRLHRNITLTLPHRKSKERGVPRSVSTPVCPPVPVTEQ